MMNVLVGNSNNIYTSSFVASTKTLSISNVNNFPLDITSLVSVYDTTVNLPFNMLQNITFSYAYVNGNPVYSWVFPTIPVGAANADTLLVIIAIPVSQAVYSVDLKIAGATI